MQMCVKVVRLFTSICAEENSELLRVVASDGNGIMSLDMIPRRAK